LVALATFTGNHDLYQRATAGCERKLAPAAPVEQVATQPMPSRMKSTLAAPTRVATLQRALPGAARVAIPVQLDARWTRELVREQSHLAQLTIVRAQHEAEKVRTVMILHSEWPSPAAAPAAPTAN